MQLELVPSQDGYRFSKSVDAFCDAVRNIIGTALASIRDIRDLEPVIMKQFFWGAIPSLEPPRMNDPDVEVRVDKILNVLSMKKHDPSSIIISPSPSKWED